MVNSPRRSAPPARPIYRRRWFALSSALVLLLVTLLVLLPLGIGYGMKRWLLQSGADTVDIENVDFNPFTGGFALHGLEVAAKDHAPLRLAALQGAIRWAPMWKNRAHIQTLALKGVRLSIERFDSGALNLGGIVLPQRAPDDDAGAPAWGFAIDRLQISGSEIRYRDSRLETGVRIRQLELLELTSWEPEQAVKLDLDLAVDEASLRISGSFSPFSAEPRFKGKVRLDGLRLDRFSGLAGPKLSTLRGGLFVDSSLDAGLTRDGGLNLAQQGRLSLEDLQVAAGTGEAVAQQIAWDGGLKAKVDPGIGGIDLESSGRLRLHAPRVAPGVGAPSLSAKLLNLTSERMGLHRDGRSGATTLSHRGSLGIEQLEGQVNNDSFSQQALRWQGDLTLSSSARNLRLATQGTLTGKGLALSLPGTDLDLDQAELHWTGKAAYGQSDGKLQLETRGDLRLGQVLLDAPQHQQELLAFDRLILKDIHIQNPQLLDVAAITFENLLFARQQAAEEAGPGTPPAAVQSRRSHLSDILYSDTEGIYVRRVEHRDLHFSMRRSPGGDFYVVGVIDILLDALSQDAGADASGAGEGKPESGPATTGPRVQAIRVRADEISVLGDSALTFADQGVNPPYQARLKFDRLRIAKLDSGRPEQSSPFELNARIGKHAQLNLHGSGRFFAERLSANISGRLDALELPPLSSYTAAALGYDLTSGQLDADIDIHVKEGKLSGKNRLQMHELEVARLDADELEKAQPQTTLPLETGLMMLRDDEGTIELELPIGGDIHDPEFDPTDAINQALAKGMQQGARTYLSAALFPFGTLITVAEVAGKAAMEIRLDPVVFGAASTTLDTTAREYLQKVAQILKKRPHLDVKICGVAVEDDREALTRLAAVKARLETATTRGKAEKAARPEPGSDQRLRALAEERAAAVKDHVIGEQGIKANRLIACRAKIDKQDSRGKPRAELLL